MRTLPDATLEIRDDDDVEYRSGYQDRKGNKYWTSSDLKNVLGKKLEKDRKPTSSTELGKAIHAYLAGQLDPNRRPFHIMDSFKKEDGKAMRRGTLDFQARWAEAEAKHGKGNFAVLTDSEMSQWMRVMPGVTEFALSLWDAAVRTPGVRNHVERCFLVSKENFADTGWSCWLFERLAEQLRTVPAFALAAKPDLVVERENTVDVYDWKTTTKESLHEIAGQSNALNYWLSMCYYGLGVERVLGKPVHTMKLLYIPKDREALVSASFVPSEAHDDGLPGFELENLETMSERIRSGLAFRDQWESKGIVDVKVSGSRLVFE